MITSKIVTLDLLLPVLAFGWGVVIRTLGNSFHDHLAELYVFHVIMHGRENNCLGFSFPLLLLNSESFC